MELKPCEHELWVDHMKGYDIECKYCDLSGEQVLDALNQRIKELEEQVDMWRKNYESTKKAGDQQYQLKNRVIEELCETTQKYMLLNTKAAKLETKLAEKEQWQKEAVPMLERLFAAMPLRAADDIETVNNLIKQAGGE